MKEDTYFYEPTGARAPAMLYRRISWGAIIAGLLVTLVVQLTLTLLGAAIGASTINPMEERDPASGLAMGSAIWLLATGLISMFAGAYVAGRMSGGPRKADGLLHGLVTWSAVTLAMLYTVVTATGAMMGGLGTLVSGAVASKQSGGGSGQEMSMASLKEKAKQAFPEASELLPPTGREASGQTPGTLTGLAQQDPELAAALARLRSAGGANAAAAERDQVINRLTAQHGMDAQQATAMVSQWDQQVQQVRSEAEPKVREAGQAAAGAVAKGALWGFLALVLGGLIAAWGGWAGTASLPRRIEPEPTPV